MEKDKCSVCLKLFTLKTLSKYEGKCGTCNKKKLTGERQKHGFVFEEEVIKLLKLDKNKDYIGKFDAQGMGFNVQIKCIKNNAEICFGDYVRNLDFTDDFLLIVGFWEGNKSNIVNICIDYIDHKKWIELLQYDKIERLKTDIDGISNKRSDDGKWKAIQKYHKERWGDRGIQLRLKRDHKNQKRVQLAIQYKYYMNEFINLTKKVDIITDKLSTLSKKISLNRG